jgi:hypothetical protein
MWTCHAPERRRLHAIESLPSRSTRLCCVNKKPAWGSAEPQAGHVIHWIGQFLPSAAARSQHALLLPADLFWQHAPLPRSLQTSAAEPRSPSTCSVEDHRDVPCDTTRDRLTDGLAGLVYQSRFGGFL